MTVDIQGYTREGEHTFTVVLPFVAWEDLAERLSRALADITVAERDEVSGLLPRTPPD